MGPKGSERATRAYGRRLRLATLVIVGAASLVWRLPAASAFTVTVFSGECTVTIQAHLVPTANKVTLSTPQPGTCVTTHGGGTVAIAGDAGPKSVQPGFTCAGGVGGGGAQLQLTTALMSVTATDARLDVVNAGGSVAISAIRDGGSMHVAAAGSLVQLPTAAEMCALGITDATWTGVIGFEHKKTEGSIAVVDGHCFVTLEAVRAGDALTLTTPQPGACTTNWGDGALTLAGTVGATDLLPGFDCAGGVGSGSGTFDVTTPLRSVRSATIGLHVSVAGATMTLTATEQDAAQQVSSAATMQESGPALDCPLGDVPTTWTGVLVLEAVQVT